MRNGTINTSICSMPLEVLNNVHVVVNISNGIAASIDPPSKKEIMKQHLILLLHTKKCNERDRKCIHEGAVPIRVSSG